MKRGAGGVFGLLTFLGGVALLLYVFRLALDVFTVAPSQAIGAKQGEALDVNVALNNLAGVGIRVVMLLVMAILGGLVAKWGIRMYAESGTATKATKDS